jgi:hypothetical protein
LIIPCETRSLKIETNEVRVKILLLAFADRNNYRGQLNVKGKELTAYSTRSALQTRANKPSHFATGILTAAQNTIIQPDPGLLWKHPLMLPHQNQRRQQQINFLPSFPAL